MSQMKKIIMIMMALFGLTLSTYPVLAAESTEPNGFTIEGIPNDHQVTSAKKIGYFYLNEKPGSSDVLKVKLINYASKDKKLKVTVADANTNRNGVIDYSGMNKNSRYLKVPLTSLVKWKEKVFTLAPREVKTIDIPFTMPKQSYQGAIVGGINVYEDYKKDKNQPQLSMRSEYGYTLGVVLTNVNKEIANCNVSVQLDSVEPKLDYGRKIVQANIANPNPYIFNTIDVQGTVQSLSDKKVIIKNKIEKVRIAPNQVFPFQFDFGKQDMKPGKYKLSVDVKTTEKTWHFEKVFEIQGEIAKKINKESVFKVYIPKWLNIAVIILLILSILGTLYIIIRKVKRNGKKDQNV